MLTDDHRQLAVTIPEGQAVPALVLAHPTLDPPLDRATLHLPDKILDRKLHRSRGYSGIDFRRVIRPANNGHANDLQTKSPHSYMQRNSQSLV
jgi:hypothetical protein